MEASVAQTYLGDILHVVSQSLLAPDIILLLVFIGYALFSIGSVIVEFFTERKHFKVVMPKFLAALMDAKEENIPQVIDDSQLLKRQKDALSTVYEYRTLPGDALVALVRRLVSEEETRYDRITGRNNTAAKVAPMLGLMGTLIPLGPGIQALGQADTASLSSSLLIAFDTTVAGLVTAAVCLVVGKIRSNWYENYLSALDAAMATMLEKIEGGRNGQADGAQSSSTQGAQASALDQALAAAGQAAAGQAAAGRAAAGQAAGQATVAGPSDSSQGGAFPFGTGQSLDASAGGTSAVVGATSAIGTGATSAIGTGATSAVGTGTGPVSAAPAVASPVEPLDPNPFVNPD